MCAGNELPRNRLVRKCVWQIAFIPVELAAGFECRERRWANEVGASVPAGETFAYDGGGGDEIG
jgi:hypothetical protein